MLALAPSPTARVSRPRYLAARRWATRHPCGQTTLVPYEDAGVL
jgi:hypothetical protein